MLSLRELNVDGKLWGHVFMFDKAGDIFPTHEHNEEDIHITVVAFGGIRVIAGKCEGLELRAIPGGMILNWKPHEPHGFVALEDGTTIINLLKKRP
jgi:hypothetical protein